MPKDKERLLGPAMSSRRWWQSWLSFTMALAPGCSDATSSDGNSRVGGNSSTLNGSNSSAVGGAAVAVGGSSFGSTTETRTSFGSTGAQGGASSTSATGGQSSAAAASTGGSSTSNGDNATGGNGTGGIAAGGKSVGGASATTGGRTIVGGSMATGGIAAGGKSVGGASTTGGRNGTGGGSAMGGKNATGGAAATGGDSSSGGSTSCDVSAPPANVAAWIEESWNAEGRNNMSGYKTWLHDSAMLGNGVINICVRYGATQSISAATRDRIAPAMERWFNKWFSKLYPYDCFPYPSVTVKVTGWAVKPGQESLLQWSNRTIPVYTEVSDGSDQAKGEPKCPDSCGFFFHPDHVFTGCANGTDAHFDYTLWLDDKLPSGAGAEGSNWGVRIPVSTFLNDLETDDFSMMLHEIGHGFGISDYYSWTGSTPVGGSVMILGTTNTVSIGDQWMARRYWSETRALRYR